VPLRKRILITSLVLTVVSTAIVGVVLNERKQERVRIVRTGNALMAVDADGLRLLNEYYAAPKTCSEEAAHMGSPTVSATIKFFDCFPRAIPITDAMIKKGVVLIQEGTKGVASGRALILPGGRLVAPNQMSMFQRAKADAVEVERIRIAQPPQENLEGWVVVWSLRRAVGPPL
jgi:hypothetical protein